MRFVWEDEYHITQLADTTYKVTGYSCHKRINKQIQQGLVYRTIWAARKALLDLLEEEYAIASAKERDSLPREMV